MAKKKGGKIVAVEDQPAGPAHPELEARSKTGLRPCPFCGSVELSLVSHLNPPRPLLIQCNGCGASGPIGIVGQAQTEEQLRALWDIRSKAA